MEKMVLLFPPNIFFVSKSKLTKVTMEGVTSPNYILRNFTLSKHGKLLIVQYIACT